MPDSPNANLPNPEEEQTPSASSNQLDELKTSRFDRRMSIAKTSLNIGRRWASNSVSGLFMDKEQRDDRNLAFRQQQAEYLASELGKLKGSVVKVGQMLALYGEHFLPPEVTVALQTLNDNTASLSWTAISTILQNQLGDKIVLFDVDPIPIGTASLAQVHRATMKKTGQQVVFKVQYPGVADAIDSDLSLFKQLLRVTNIVPQTKILEDWFDEIQDLLHTEVNYHIEATTTQRFYERLKDDDRYVVPQILPDYSTDRVLCMTYEHGVAVVNPIVPQLSQQRRDALGQSAINIMMQEIFTWGEMQTDPNFGNYLIRMNSAIDVAEPEVPDQVVLLDFGAIRHFDDKLLTIAKALLTAGFYQHIDAMYTAMKGYPFFDEMSHDVRYRMAEVFLVATEPFSHPRYYHQRINNDVSKNTAQKTQALLDENGNYDWSNSKLHDRVMQQAKAAMQSLEFSLPPKEFMFISRKFIGAYTFMTVLDAHTNSLELMKTLIPYD